MYVTNLSQKPDLIRHKTDRASRALQETKAIDHRGEGAAQACLPDTRPTDWFKWHPNTCRWPGNHRHCLTLISMQNSLFKCSGSRQREARLGRSTTSPSTGLNLQSPSWTDRASISATLFADVTANRNYVITISGSQTQGAHSGLQLCLHSQPEDIPLHWP